MIMSPERQTILENILEIREISRVHYGVLTAYNKDIAEHKDKIGSVWILAMSELEEYVSELEIRALREAAEKIDICYNYTGNEESIKTLVTLIAGLGRSMRVGNGELRYCHQLGLKITVCKKIIAFCYGDKDDKLS